MIDLHTHILPGIDDGASSVEEAIKMTEELYKQNVEKAVCTPHFHPATCSMSEFISDRNRAMDQMKHSKIVLMSGSETVLHEYIFHYPDLSELCFQNTRYLLLELPYQGIWDHKIYDMICKLITLYGVIPIIAHVERYHTIKKNIKNIKKLTEAGCIIQLNTATILNEKSRRQAIGYIKHGYIDVLGSDCHDMTRRPPVLEEAFQIIGKKLGENYCNELRNNAKRIVRNELITGKEGANLIIY